MAYDEGLAQRLRKHLGEREDLVERRMFGGLAFMLAGHMACGVIGDRLMVRVGPEHYEQALRRPHAREMDFTGRPLKGFVFVEPPGFADDEDLKAWIEQGLGFVSTLPAKGGHG